MIGAGGFAKHWIRGVLSNFTDRLEVIALVDINPDALHASGDFLGLPASGRFRDMREAFEKCEADFCIVVIPPAYHKDAVFLAAERRIPVLSEKPIADTWEGCVEIYRAVKSAGIKMEVVQNYRYTPRILTFKKALQDVGKINYLFARFGSDYRERGSWGAFRHQIAHSLLIEGSVHHFDQVRNLTESDCEEIAGWDWNPDHPSFDGECCGLYVMRMANGTFANYEGNCLSAGWQNSWHQEYFRAECEDGAVTLDRDGVVRIYRHKRGEGLQIKEVPPVVPDCEGHNWIVNEFLNWLEGGPEPPTSIDDNIKSAGILFSAIKASEEGRIIRVPDLLSALH